MKRVIEVLDRMGSLGGNTSSEGLDRTRQPG